jgi:hypothetical protein
MKKELKQEAMMEEAIASAELASDCEAGMSRKHQEEMKKEQCKHEHFSLVCNTCGIDMIQEHFIPKSKVKEVAEGMRDKSNDGAGFGGEASVEGYNQALKDLQTHLLGETLTPEK